MYELVCPGAVAYVQSKIVYLGSILFQLEM